MDLPERFARGDLEAFELLFRQFQPEVHRWLTRMVRDAAAADDLTVEVFWRIYRARATFDFTRSFGAWARRIASNVAIDHLRKAQRATPTGVPRTTSSAQSSAQLDLHIRVERAFTQLSPKLRLVAELGLVDEWSVEEIAAALGITRTAVKFRLIRARNSLRKALERQGIKP
ncbi:sigma-70 family RNA polymerase sigma factor [soil metagenome]